MSDEQILPCVMCNQHHEQMLMLSCMHDPCINCASINFCSNQSMNSNTYICAKCSDETQLDNSSVVELQRIFQQLKSKKKYDYRRNLGGFSQGSNNNKQSFAPTYNAKAVTSNSQYPVKTKTQTSKYVSPNYSHLQHEIHPEPQPQYTPVSQPSYPSNPYNNIIVKKSQQPVYMCETHPQQQLSYFCFDCRNPICPECAIHGSHRDHEVQTTRKAIRMIKSNLNESQSDVSNQINKVTSIRDNFRNKNREMTDIHKKDKELIRDHFGSLVAILHEKQKEFQRSLDTTHDANSNIAKNYITEADGDIEAYIKVNKNIDGTLKKDDLTILQEYSRRENEAKQKILGNQKKSYQRGEIEGIKFVDYGLFKDEMEQLSGIIQALRLTTKNNSTRH